MADDERGHRHLPHTADALVEAWGPSRVACLEEAVVGLVTLFADVAGVDSDHHVPVTLPGEPDDLLLLGLLTDVIVLLDADGLVPVGASLAETADGGIEGILRAAALEAVSATGAAPKGIAHSDLVLEGRGAHGWQARFVVDV